MDDKCRTCGHWEWEACYYYDWGGCIDHNHRYWEPQPEPDLDDQGEETNK